MTPLDDFTVTITCAECGQKTEEKVRRLKRHDTVTLRCGHRVSTKEAQRTLASADEALDRLRRDLSRFGKLG